jgi:magnesium and cobalt transporter
MKDMFKFLYAPDEGASASAGKAPAIQKTRADDAVMHRAFEANGGVTPERSTDSDPEDRADSGILDRLRGLIGIGRQPDNALRDAIEEYIEESANGSATAAVTTHEKALITNAIKLRDMTVVDVMIPRASIVAIPAATSEADLLALLSEKQYSRLPVFRETLDDVFGAIHIKDILACLARGTDVRIEDLVRDVPIVSPAMPVLDLILMMKEMRKHMVFVVDEYGGIDGLVTIGDVIEAIIGEVEDEHATDDETPQMVRNAADGTIIADGRTDIEQFEKTCGKFLSSEEREDIDTLGGLVFALAGRVPGRGEILTHPSGIVLEILDADPRRVNKVLIRNIPASKETGN